MHGGRRIRHQAHVGLVDRLPAGDRRAVEHLAFGERLLFDHRDVEGDVLPLAARIGETEIDVFHVVVLDHLQDVFGGRHGMHTLSRIHDLGQREVARAIGGLDGVESGFPRPDPDGFLDVGDENLAVADPPGLGGAADRLDGFFDHVVAEHNLDLHLGEKIHDVFGARDRARYGPSAGRSPWPRSR